MNRLPTDHDIAFFFVNVSAYATCETRQLQINQFLTSKVADRTVKSECRKAIEFGHPKFAIIKDKQILTFKKLKTANIWRFCFLKNTHFRVALPVQSSFSHPV